MMTIAAYDVFLRNITNGFAELISARQPSLPSRTGVGSCQLSSQPISQDGRYVTFASDADGLAPGNTSLAGFDVYACDLYAGTNQIVSVGMQGNAASGISVQPVISGNGRYVAFTSAATNLIAVDTNNATDVFVRDLQAQTTTLVSVNSAGTGEGNKDSYSPTISTDGRFILFVSKASNLTSGSFSGTDNLFLRDQLAGTNYALDDGRPGRAAMTPDGHFVAFVNGKSAATDLCVGFATGQTGRPAMRDRGSHLSAGHQPGWQPHCEHCRLKFADDFDMESGVEQVYSVASGYDIYSPPGLRFSADGRFLTYAYPIPRLRAGAPTKCIFTIVKPRATFW